MYDIVIIIWYIELKIDFFKLWCYQKILKLKYKI